MNLLGKNISANLLSNVWLTILLLLVTPLYVWFLGIESYGLIGFYLSWVAILGVLDTSISATTMREFSWLKAQPLEKKKIPGLLKSLESVYWAIIVVFGLGFLIGASIFGEDWFQTKDLEPELVRESMMLMAVSLVVQVPSGLYVSGLMGLQKQVECSGLLAFFGTLRALGAIVVLWLIASDIRLFFLWQIVVSSMQTGVIRWSLWKKVRVDGDQVRFSWETLKPIKGFAGGMLVVTVLSILMTQADKMILSKMISLEIFGYYMLAWSVASGLSRVVTPLTQAYYPRFTELVATKDDIALTKELRLASQLTNVMIMPPAMLIGFLSKSILFAWTGNLSVADSAAPILSFMVVGTIMTSCSYPALTILFSKKQIKPVIIVNLVSLVVLLPLLIFAVIQFGVMGAVFIWGLYGLVLYISFQVYGLREIHQVGFFSIMLRDFVAPGLASLAVASMAGYWLGAVSGKITFVTLLSITLIVSWLTALLVCKDLREIITRKSNWLIKTSL